MSEFIDAGSIFYAVDIWNGCDVIIILIGAAFLVTSELFTHNYEVRVANSA